MSCSVSTASHDKEQQGHQPYSLSCGEAPACSKIATLPSHSLEAGNCSFLWCQTLPWWSFGPFPFCLWLGPGRPSAD